MHGRWWKLNFPIILVLGDQQTLAMSSPKASELISLSLWLLPPESSRVKVKVEIDRLCRDGDIGPKFEPHITLVGGIKCRSEAHVNDIAKILEDGLKSTGDIPCNMNGVPCASEGVWNQALYLQVEMSQPFINLCQKARSLIGMETDNWVFPSPASHAHMSLFYGIDDLVPNKSEVQAVSDFRAHTVALWRTYPASLEGVAQWREVTCVDIR